MPRGLLPSSAVQKARLSLLRGLQSLGLLAKDTPLEEGKAGLVLHADFPRNRKPENAPDVTDGWQRHAAARPFWTVGESPVEGLEKRSQQSRYQGQSRWATAQELRGYLTFNQAAVRSGPGSSPKLLLVSQPGVANPRKEEMQQHRRTDFPR